jgi:hypothetical protein
MFMIPLLFAASMSVLNSSVLQSASGQGINNIGTFSAKGYSGQIIVLPPTYSQIQSNHIASPAVGSIISGNWSFAVKDGQVQQFKWDSQAITLSGKVNGSLSINGISHTSNINTSPPLSIVKLVGNHTSFKGDVNISTNGKTTWTSVPVVVSLLNGKLINLSISPTKTDDFFTIPLFGVVTSLIH